MLRCKLLCTAAASARSGNSACTCLASNMLSRYTGAMLAAASEAGRVLFSAIRLPCVSAAAAPHILHTTLALCQIKLTTAASCFCCYQAAWCCCAMLHAAPHAKLLAYLDQLHHSRLAATAAWHAPASLHAVISSTTSAAAAAARHAAVPCCTLHQAT
jgi:hypothetical protein